MKNDILTTSKKLRIIQESLILNTTIGGSKVWIFSEDSCVLYPWLQPLIEAVHEPFNNYPNDAVFAEFRTVVVDLNDVDPGAYFHHLEDQMEADIPTHELIEWLARNGSSGIYYMDQVLQDEPVLNMSFLLVDDFNYRQKIEKRERAKKEGFYLLQEAQLRQRREIGHILLRFIEQEEMPVTGKYG